MPVAGYHTSLQEFITSEWREKGQHAGLAAVIMAVADGSCQVEQHVRQAALADALGTTGETNVQDEIVQLLDKASSDIFVETLRRSGHVAATFAVNEEPSAVDRNQAILVLGRRG